MFLFCRPGLGQRRGAPLQLKITLGADQFMSGKLLGFISGIIGTAIEHMSSLRLTLKAGRPQYWRSLGWTLAARLCILISMVQLQKHAATKFSENLAARTTHGWQALMIWLGCRRLDLLHLFQRAVLLRLGRKEIGRAHV